jgi:hypothetical protein
MEVEILSVLKGYGPWALMCGVMAWFIWKSLDQNTQALIKVENTLAKMNGILVMLAGAKPACPLGKECPFTKATGDLLETSKR